MNNLRDIASELSETAQRVPFPPAQRQRVLGYGTGLAMYQDWKRWAGESEFPPDGNWGIAILESNRALLFHERRSLETVFARGGDVFEWCPVRRNFTRLDEATFRLFYT